jgi:hypothetical protein
LQFGFVRLRRVEQFLGAFAAIDSDDDVHDGTKLFPVPVVETKGIVLIPKNPGGASVLASRREPWV